MKKRICIGLFLLFFLSAIVFSYEITLVSKGASNWMARNRLNYINLIPLKDKDGIYEILNTEEVIYKGNLLCEIYHLYPRGHILIPSYREFVPVKSFSVVSNFNSKSKGYEYAVLEELKATYDFLVSYGEGEIPELETAIKDNQGSWKINLQIDLSSCQLQEVNRDEELEGNPQIFILQNGNNIKIRAVYAQPLVLSRWGQGYPYNKKCPKEQGKKCWVGCVATAMAQIMKYHSWPEKGKGIHSYTWKGKNLKATFNDSYNWNKMPYLTSQYTTQSQISAISELSYELGVSVDMNYGLKGSGAYISDSASAFKNYFKYPKTKVVYRKNYSSKNKWFNVFKKQVDGKKPCLFAMYSADSGHAVVIDGYLSSTAKSGINTAGSKKVHINMGWEGSCDAYYDFDNILNYTETYWQHAAIDIKPEQESKKPDLRVSRIWLKKESSDKLSSSAKKIAKGDPSDFSGEVLTINPGDTFYIYTTIKNSGKADAKDYYLNISYDSSTATGGPSDLKVKKKDTWRYGPWTATAGTHTVKVEVNPSGANRISESNYNNNKKTQKYTFQ